MPTAATLSLTALPGIPTVGPGTELAPLLLEAATRAGIALQAGDILIGFDTKKIENLYDFTYALRAHKPGDRVSVTVQRNGEKVTREVTLEVRK